MCGTVLCTTRDRFTVLLGTAPSWARKPRLGSPQITQSAVFCGNGEHTLRVDVDIDDGQRHRRWPQCGCDGSLQNEQLFSWEPKKSIQITSPL